MPHYFRVPPIDLYWTFKSMITLKILFVFRVANGGKTSSTSKAREAAGHFIAGLMNRKLDLSGWKLVITGHSLGGGAAALIALKLCGRFKGIFINFNFFIAWWFLKGLGNLILVLGLKSMRERCLGRFILKVQRLPVIVLFFPLEGNLQIRNIGPIKTAELQSSSSEFALEEVPCNIWGFGNTWFPLKSFLLMYLWDLLEAWAALGEKK